MAEEKKEEGEEEAEACHLAVEAVETFGAEIEG